MKMLFRILQMTLIPLSITLTVVAEDRPAVETKATLSDIVELKKVTSLTAVDLQIPNKTSVTEQNLKQAVPLQERKMIKSGLAKGTGSSGGGDAIERTATPLKNKELLKNAVQLAITTVTKSDLSKNYKLKFVQEINHLYSQDLFQEVPSLFISQDFLKSWNPLLGYQSPEGDGQFLDLACITKFSAGSKIICSSLRISNYNVDELASTLLHEVLHHILPVVLSSDEEFVEDLGNAIVENKINKAIQYALIHQIYIRKGMIRRDQFLVNFDLVIKLAKKDWNIVESCGNKIWTQSDLIDFVKWRLPANISSASIALIPHLIENFLSANSRCVDFKLMTQTPIILSNMKFEALGVDISKESFLKDYVNTLTWGCQKVKKGNLLYPDSCDSADEIKFEDILLPLVNEHQN